MDVLKNGEILLHGTVGEGLFEDGFTAVDVISALAEVGRTADIVVRLNSGGGLAMEGIAIHNAFHSHRGKVTVVVEAIAASAASLLAMAGDEIVMRTGATMMVHDPSGITLGTAADHQKSVEMLETIGASMAAVYAEKTGRPIDEVRAEMIGELWMTAAEAVEKGYADKTDEQRTEPTAAFDYRLYSRAPERLVAMAEACNWKLNPDAGPPPSPAPLPIAPKKKSFADLLTPAYARLNGAPARPVKAMAIPKPAPIGHMLPEAAEREIWARYNRVTA